MYFYYLHLKPLGLTQNNLHWCICTDILKPRDTCAHTVYTTFNELFASISMHLFGWGELISALTPADGRINAEVASVLAEINVITVGDNG